MKSCKYLNAINGSNTDSPPIWFMRQAGRYLPEYRDVRQNYTFNEMISSPDIVTEITLQPIKRFGFDAAILYSDILVVPNAFGLHFDFIEKKGPVLRQNNDIGQLVQQLSSFPDLSACQFVFDAVKQLKNELLSYNTPLIGFAGSPFTVACYLIEGGSSKTFATIKQLIQDQPDSLHVILQSLTEATISYLIEQIKSGADTIQLFDTWASLLDSNHYDLFSFQYIKQICDALAPFNVPIILFGKNTTLHLKKQLELPIHVIGVDSFLPLKKARDIVQSKVALQGNLNPELLLTNPETITKAVKEILNQMKNDSAFIFNLGHGILPTTPLDHVQLVVDLVQNV